MENEREPYYDEEEVVGSYGKYHRKSCHLIRNIYERNRKRLQSWQKAVDLGLEPCGVCNPFYTRSTARASSSAQVQASESLTISATQLADWRRKLIRLLDALDRGSEPPERGGLADRISRLQRAGIIPREIVAMMRTITEMRNATEYQSKSLSTAESSAVKAAWTAIQEWAQGRGIDSLA
ncbi:MAG: hypothetical protein M3R69_12010 [Acidobacteriota bacterium]|nr:hypothetical protein [Acidobacteriota bacterium]